MAQPGKTYAFRIPESDPLHPHHDKFRPRDEKEMILRIGNHRKHEREYKLGRLTPSRYKRLESRKDEEAIKREIHLLHLALLDEYANTQAQSKVVAEIREYIERAAREFHETWWQKKAVYPLSKERLHEMQEHALQTFQKIEQLLSGSKQLRYRIEKDISRELHSFLVTEGRKWDLPRFQFAWMDFCSHLKKDKNLAQVVEHYERELEADVPKAELTLKHAFEAIVRSLDTKSGTGMKGTTNPLVAIGNAFAMVLHVVPDMLESESVLNRHLYDDIQRIAKLDTRRAMHTKSF